MSATTVASAASSASRALKAVSGLERNAALTACYNHLQAAKDEVLEANKRDLLVAGEQVKAGELSQSLAKRLDLCRPGKWEDMLQGIIDVRDLEDPGKNSCKDPLILSH